VWEKDFSLTPGACEKWFQDTLSTLNNAAEGSRLSVADDDGMLLKDTSVRAYRDENGFYFCLAGTDTRIFEVKRMEDGRLVFVAAHQPFSLELLLKLCPSFCYPREEAQTKPILANLQSYWLPET
jgi:hypothetical protein